MLQDAVEHGPGGHLQVVPVLVIFKVMFIGRDVGAVGFPAAGHRDVKGFPGHLG